MRKFPVLSETFVLNELLALEERGVPLHIFSLQRPNDPRFHDDLPKLKARVSYLPELGNLGKLLRHNLRLAKRRGRPYGGTLLYAAAQGKPSLIWRLLQAGFVANEARRLGLTHLHAQFANRPTTVAQLASRITGIPFSFTAHAMDIYKASVSARTLARKVRDARFVVTVSDFNRQHLERLVEPGAGKIVRVYNGINLTRFAPNGMPSRSPFNILCVARLVEKKGLPVLIDACRRLRDKDVAFRCTIVGKGRLRPQLEAQIKQDGLRQHVKLVGPRTQLEVLDHYRSAHLYVLPCVVGADGNRDGLPVSIVEALACGVPVITTPVTGNPEVVDHLRNGLLVPPGDAEALADAVEQLVRDPDLYDRLRSGARPSIEPRFDMAQTSATLHGLLAGDPV